VCPADAVRTDAGAFEPWSSPGLDPIQARMFLDGKRSVRRYRDEPLDRSLLDEIVGRGFYSATASNSQDCGATVFQGEEVCRLGGEIIGRYQKIYRLISNPLVHLIVGMTGAGRYTRGRKAMERFREFVEGYAEGRDQLFHGAPAVVCLTHPRRNRTFGTIDCTLAGAAMMYYADALRIGSCMIGFAQIALNLFPGLRKAAGIGNDRRVGLVFTLGRSKPVYYRLPVREFHTAPTQAD